MKQADGHHCPKLMGCQVQERGSCGQNGANGKFRSIGLKAIRYTPSDGTTHESQCGCRTKHETELFGPEPAFCKKGRQERRSKSEPTEECGVERHKSNEHAAHHGHGSAGSSRGLGFEPHRLDGSFATMPGFRRSRHQCKRSSLQANFRMRTVRDGRKTLALLRAVFNIAGRGDRLPTQQ